MDPDPELQLRDGPAVDIRIQIAQTPDQRQRGEQRALGIVAVRGRIAEIDEEAVAEGLSDEPAEALHGRYGQSLVATQKQPQLFGIEPLGPVRKPEQAE